MPARWTVSNWPPCEFHVFLSHCAEDRDRLVIPVYRELERLDLIPWIDRHHYPAGHDPFDALREQIASCRHVVYFVTPAMLRQGRGWAAVERCIASIIQKRLVLDSVNLCHFELPLFFLPSDNTVLPRSVWGSLAPSSARYVDSRRSFSKQIDWAVSTISSFLKNEQRWADQLADDFARESTLRSSLRRMIAGDIHLQDRILAATPAVVAY